jgi:hypothetical protein
MSGSIKLTIVTNYCIIYFDDNLSVSYSYQNGEQQVINTIRKKEAAFTEKIREAFHNAESNFTAIKNKGINVLEISDSISDYKEATITLKDLKISSIRSVKLKLHIKGMFDKSVIMESIRPLMIELSKM